MTRRRAKPRRPPWVMAVVLVAVVVTGWAAWLLVSGQRGGGYDLPVFALTIGIMVGLILLARGGWK